MSKKGTVSAYSTFLFARPSWWSGAARIFDWAGTLNSYNTFGSPDEADWYALAADWYAVGDDLRASIQEARGLRKGRGLLQPHVSRAGVLIREPGDASSEDGG
jgi:hypothetical protein